VIAIDHNRNIVRDPVVGQRAFLTSVINRASLARSAEER
jgi:hypothetical protein